MNFDENELQSVREERFAAERVERRAARKAASLDSRGAHLGAVIVTVALVLLSWYGKLAALGIVSGVFCSGSPQPLYGPTPTGTRASMPSNARTTSPSDGATGSEHQGQARGGGLTSEVDPLRSGP